MGSIPDIDKEYAETEAIENPGAGGGLPPGPHQVTVVKATVGPSPKPWIDSQFSVQIQDANGITDFINLEVAPLTSKNKETGNVELSKGKIGFLKGQLQKLGYNGPLTKLETPEVLNSFQGVQIKVNVKEEPQKNKDGTIRLRNDNTPWMNHEVLVDEFISGGLGAAPVPGQVPGGGVTQVAPVQTASPANVPVY